MLTDAGQFLYPSYAQGLWKPSPWKFLVGGGPDSSSTGPAWSPSGRVASGASGFEVGALGGAGQAGAGGLLPGGQLGAHGHGSRSKAGGAP